MATYPDADPWRNFKFEVEISGWVQAGFRSVSGLNRTTEIVEYREGGEAETPHKLPGQTTWENITLERGMAARDTSHEFLEWCKLIYEIDDGNNPGNTGDPGGLPGFRKKITIWLKNKKGNRVAKWTVKKAWPAEWQHEDLDASGNDVFIERLVLANEGWQFKKGDDSSNLI